MFNFAYEKFKDDCFTPCMFLQGTQDFQGDKSSVARALSQVSGKWYAVTAVSKWQVVTVGWADLIGCSWV